MHVVTKLDGNLRRTADLGALNPNCLRETQHAIPSYKQSRLVLAAGFRTVTDCWNGYHSFPLAKEGKHLTTFITECGRYEYRAASQRFLAAGDGYNRKYATSLLYPGRLNVSTTSLCRTTNWRTTGGRSLTSLA